MYVFCVKVLSFERLMREESKKGRYLKKHGKQTNKNSNNQTTPQGPTMLKQK